LFALQAQRELVVTDSFSSGAELVAVVSEWQGTRIEPALAKRVAAEPGEVRVDQDVRLRVLRAMRLAYYDERVIETMADAIALDGSHTVADVGTGTGFIAAGLAPRAGRVIAIDHSPAMLDVARVHLAELGLDNVELIEGDLGRLPLEDDSIDAAVANMVLHHAEDPAAMLAEMARVVKPGGWVAITDEVEHPYAWMVEEHADVWLGFTADQVEGFFGSARLAHYGYAPLGSQ
jgi:ArsR family transcriptional regulator